MNNILAGSDVPTQPLSQSIQPSVPTPSTAPLSSTDPNVGPDIHQSGITDSINQNTSGDANNGGKAIASFILGLLGLVGWFIPIIGAPIVITGLVLGILSINSSRRGLAIAGIVLASIGLILTVANAAIGAYMGATGQHSVVRQLNSDGVIDQMDIEQLVFTMKQEANLPQTYEAFTMVDITAQPNAIRFEFVVSGIDFNKMTIDPVKAAKDIALQDVCSEEYMSLFFDQNIRVEYDFLIEETGEKFDFVVVKEDCV